MKNDLHPLTKQDHALLIKAARVSLGNISQLKLSSLLGVSVKTVQQWEQGLRSPGGTVFLLLERIFDEKGISRIK